MGGTARRTTRRRSRPLCALACTFVCAFGPSSSAAHLYGQPTRFRRGEGVPILANVVWPAGNPSETYEYYSLPFCPPAHKDYIPVGLDGYLVGDRPVNTPYTVNFREIVESRVLCKRVLSGVEHKAFLKAVQCDYQFELFIDGMPTRVPVGMNPTPPAANKNQTTAPLSAMLLPTHLIFELQFNKDHVVGVTARPDNETGVVDLAGKDAVAVQFSYSVVWLSSDVDHEHRLNSSMPWVQWRDGQQRAIEGGCKASMLVLPLLLVLVWAVVPRGRFEVVDNTKLQYDPPEEEIPPKDRTMDYISENTADRSLYIAIFKPPTRNLSLLCAMLGAGAQMVAIALALSIWSAMGTSYPYQRGALRRCCIYLYAVTCGVASYVSGYLYRALGGTKRIANMLLTAILFPIVVLVNFTVVNMVATACDSTAALPLDTIGRIAAIWVIIGLCSTWHGAVVAERYSVGPIAMACFLVKLPPADSTPPQPWTVRRQLRDMLLSCLECLQFACGLFAVLVSYQFSQVHPNRFMLIVSCILLLASGTVFGIYKTLDKLKHHHQLEEDSWWWLAFHTGASSSMLSFVVVQVIWQGSNMHGTMQQLYFFSWWLVGTFAIALALGFINVSTGYFYVLHGTRACGAGYQPGFIGFKLPTTGSPRSRLCVPEMMADCSVTAPTKDCPPGAHGSESEYKT